MKSVRGTREKDQNLINLEKRNTAGMLDDDDDDEYTFVFLNQGEYYLLFTWKTPWASAPMAKWRGVRLRRSRAFASAP